MVEFKMKDIPGYEGSYMITSFGDVISYKQHKPRTLSHKFSERGYHAVDLSDCGVRKRYTVAHLVAEAFVPNPDPENLTVVQFIDGNINNLHADNLEWRAKEKHLMTEEMKDKATEERRKIAPFIDRTPVIEALRKEVCALDDDNRIVKIYPSLREAERSLGCTHIYDAIHRGYKKAGYHWDYYKEGEKK